MRQIKRQLRFVRLLHKAGKIQRAGDYYRVSNGLETASLESQYLKALVSQGVLAQNGDQFS